MWLFKLICLNENIKKTLGELIYLLHEIMNTKQTRGSRCLVWGLSLLPLEKREILASVANVIHHLVPLQLQPLPQPATLSLWNPLVRKREPSTSKLMWDRDLANSYLKHLVRKVLLPWNLSMGVSGAFCLGGQAIFFPIFQTLVSLGIDLTDCVLKKLNKIGLSWAMLGCN